MKARDVILEVEGLTKRFRSGKGNVVALEDDFLQDPPARISLHHRPLGLRQIDARPHSGGAGSRQRRPGAAGWPAGERAGRERGMVFQGYTLFPWLTVRKNVMFGLLNNNIGRSRRRNRPMNGWA
jgi:NitT/TauT family transport system ATP-binding protein